MKKNVMVLMAPTVELAQTVKANATIEAEYGDYCIEGSELTAAHHGVRSFNPAPCNNPNINPLDLSEPKTILLSHLDLDSIGGVLAAIGEKPEDPDFWQGAEYIDVNGPHHMHELSQDVQDKINAYNAWVATLERAPRATTIVDMTATITNHQQALETILTSPERSLDNGEAQRKMIEAGKEWATNITAQVEEKLLTENDHVRVFKTDGVFCSSAYYSQKDNAIKDATVVLNERFGSITIAFADNGKQLHANDIAKELWGPAAGGHNGIAGSPRGWDLTPEQLMNELKRATHIVNDKIEQIRSQKGPGDGNDNQEFDNRER